MSWGLDDLEKFVNGLRGTFSGKDKPGFNPAAKTTNAAIVNPLKLGAEFSGVAQAHRGVKPGASAVDQGLGMLALLSYLGGQEAAIAMKNALTPEYVYGLHLNPEKMGSVPKKIKTIKNAETRYGPGAQEWYNSFFGSAKSPEMIPERAAESTMKWGRRYYDGTASVVRAKAKDVVRDTRSPVGFKTDKALKVIKSIPWEVAPDTPEYDYLINDILSGDITVLDKKLLKKLINLPNKKR